MLRLLACAVLAASTLLVACSTHLVPARRYVANTDFQGEFQVSPDGSRIASRAVRMNRGAVVVRNLADGTERAIAVQTGSVEWAADSRHLLLTLSDSGNEQFHVWTVDVTTGEAPRDLTPGSGKWLTVRSLPKRPGEIVVKGNARLQGAYDLFRLELASGRMEEIDRNPGGVYDWIVAADGAVRARIVQDGTTRRLVATDAGGAREIATWTVFDLVQFMGLTAEGDAAWALSNVGRDKVALVKLDLATGRESVVHEEADVDLEWEDPGATVIGPRTRKPLLVSAEPDYPLARFLDPALGAMFTKLFPQRPARLRVTSIDDAERKAVVSVYDGRGTRWHLVDLEQGTQTVLAQDVFAGLGDVIVPARPISFRARDGVLVHGYLTEPPGGTRPHPTVLRVHGGPWYRNIWGNTDLGAAATQVQFLVNRGYAVLEVNFRGSTGYGRGFVELSSGEFAGTMQNDLEDGVRWAVAQGATDPRRVAIVGTSYGGYATLVGLTRTPELYACGMAAAAPGDLVDLVAGFPKDWAFDLPYWHRRVGDPAREQDRARMAAQSPIHQAAALQRPLLLVHGSDDPRVQVSQAERFAAAANGPAQKVDLLVFRGEGHSIEHWAHKLKFYRRLEDHLASCLGGSSGGFDVYEVPAFFVR